MSDKELRHIPHHTPDYDLFLAYLEQPTTGEAPSPFRSSIEYAKLQEAMRSWLLQNIQLVMKAWPPTSVKSPTSVSGRYEQDFSIYTGTGKEHK